MKYVLDSSVAVKWAIAEADTDKALTIRNDFNTATAELVAPDFFPIEITHSLTRAERQGRITPDEASAFLVDLIHNLPELHASLPLCHGHTSSRLASV
jgi:predicted nucleic acid-binding protein